MSEKQRDENISQAEEISYKLQERFNLTYDSMNHVEMAATTLLEKFDKESTYVMLCGLIDNVEFFE